MPGVLRKPQHRAVRPVPAAAVLIWHTSPLFRKNKNTSHAQGGIRGEFLAVPLSFLTFPAAIGAEPGAITPRAPGRTSHPASPGPLSAGEGPSLFAGADGTLSVPRAYRILYYHPPGRVSSPAGLFLPFAPGKEKKPRDPGSRGSGCRKSGTATFSRRVTRKMGLDSLRKSRPILREKCHFRRTCRRK